MQWIRYPRKRRNASSSRTDSTTTFVADWLHMTWRTFPDWWQRRLEQRDLWKKEKHILPVRKSLAVDPKNVRILRLQSREMEKKAEMLSHRKERHDCLLNQAEVRSPTPTNSLNVRLVECTIMVNVGWTKVGATCVENWDIACVTVQNDKIPIWLDLNLLYKDKQRVLDPVVVVLGNEISGRNFCKGESCNIPDPETIIWCTYHAMNACILY